MPFIQGLQAHVNGPAETLNVQVNVDPEGPIPEWFEDGDVLLESRLLGPTGTVEDTVAMAAVPNRGDTPARHYFGQHDLNALALPADGYSVEIAPAATQWTQTNPADGSTSNVSTANLSHCQMGIVLEAVAAMVTRQWVLATGGPDCS